MSKNFGFNYFCVGIAHCWLKMNEWIDDDKEARSSRPVIEVMIAFVVEIRKKRTVTRTSHYYEIRRWNDFSSIETHASFCNSAIVTTKISPFPTNVQKDGIVFDFDCYITAQSFIMAGVALPSTRIFIESWCEPTASALYLIFSGRMIWNLHIRFPLRLFYRIFNWPDFWLYTEKMGQVLIRWGRIFTPLSPRKVSKWNRNISFIPNIYQLHQRFKTNEFTFQSQTFSFYHLSYPSGIV